MGRGKFYKGNIVTWNDSLWVVQKSEPDSAILIAWDGTNLTAHPSTTWPKNPRSRLDSVKYVARCGSDFLKTILKKAESELMRASTAGES